MTEGGGAHMAGQIPLDEEFVRALPDLASNYGTIWHMDEVVTGFRDQVAIPVLIWVLWAIVTALKIY